MGSGRIVAHVFAENQKLFGSARTILIPELQGHHYGLLPEHAWNYGASYLKGFQIGSIPLNVNLDLFRTSFVNQVVVDWETLGQVSFYNLDGDSYANSLQFGLDASLFRMIDARFSYKFYDVQIDYIAAKKNKIDFILRRTNLNFELQNELQQTLNCNIISDFMDLFE